MLSIGQHSFHLEEYAERMNVVQGELEMETTKVACTLEPGASEVAPANSPVLFEAKTAPVFYICEYEKTG